MIEITDKDLFEKVGRQAVEIDVLRAELAKAQAELEAALAAEEDT